MRESKKKKSVDKDSDTKSLEVPSDSSYDSDLASSSDSDSDFECNTDSDFECNTDPRGLCGFGDSLLL
jgi:hypothetical protein